MLGLPRPVELPIIRKGIHDPLEVHDELAFMLKSVNELYTTDPPGS